MSFKDEYMKLRSERISGTSGSNTSSAPTSFAEQYTALRNERLANPSTKTNSAPVAPVSARVTTRMTVKSEEDEEEEKKKEEERTWFKKGDDSIAKTILGTGADLLEDITAGILGIGEKFVDAGAMLAPYAANASLHMDGFTTPEVEKAYKDLQEDAKKEVSSFVQKDLYDETAVARKIISGVGSAPYLDSKIQSGYVTTEDLKFAQELNEPVLDYMENDMEEDSVLGAKSDALVQSAGQLAGQYGLSMVGVPWFVTSGVSTFGAEAENALKNGATHEEAVGSGSVSAAAEILSEKLFGGDLFVKKGSLDLATKHLAANVTNKAWRTFLKWGGDTLGEGVEEVFSEFVSKLGSSLYREENLGEILFSEEAIQDYIDSFAGGFGLGGVMGGINVAQAKAKGVDFTSGLTIDEQRVVQTELNNRLAEKGDKVTAREKAKLYEEVVQDMKNGRFSTENTEAPVVEEIKMEEEPPEVLVVEDEILTEEKPKRVLYTGSPNTDIKQFKVGGVDGSRQSGDRYGRGVYLTTNESTAKNYAGENGRVYQTSVDDLNVFNLNDKITPEMKENLVSGLRDTDPQYRNSVLRNFRSEMVFEDLKSAEAFHKQQRSNWKEQDGYYDANKPVIKSVDHETGKVVIEYTDFSNWENVIGDLTGIQLYDALKSLSTDDFSSFITANGFDGISFDEDADNQQFVIYRNEDRIKIDNPVAEDVATVSETENVAPSVPTAEQEVAATIEPKTTAEKAQEHYRGDILNRGDILSKLVNSGKTTMKAVTDATAQAQTLISKGADGVKSIGDIFGRISTDGKLGDFEDYLHHLLNVDRRTLNDRFGIHDRPVWGYSAEESQKRADKLAEENPEFVKAAEDVYAFNDYIMRVRVQSGKITQEQADIWKQYYPHYVPISRGGNADTYSTLLKFAEGDTTGIQSLDEFSVEADRAADVHKVKAVGDDFDPLMDTMVNAAFTAHWGLAISDNGVTAPTAPVQTQTTQEAPVADTTVETQTVDDYVPSAEKAPSPDAVQPADHESIRLMDQHDGVRGKLDDAVHWAEDNILDNGRVFEKIDRKKGNRNLYSHWHAIRNAFSSAQHFIGKGNSAKGVRALNDIYAEINKKGLTSDFDSYLAHQRNIDGMTMQARYGVAANREVIKGASAAQSYREVRKLETDHPEFKQWAKDIYANTGYVIDQMVEHKMLSQDMADLFKVLYPHYVPVRYGKNGALESSLESMGQFTVEAFNSFAMNDFGLELKHTLRSEIDREDMNIDTFIDRLDSGASLFDFDVNGMDEDYHTLTVYEDGELKTFDITREMYMAMNQTRNWMDWKIPLLYQANEGFRKATTELNWIFAATNGIKDPQEIMWNSQHPLETYAKFLPAEAAVWSKDSKYRHYYEEYLANGGESVEYFNPNNNKFDADKGVLAYLNQKIGTGAISNLNGRVETAPRLAEYIASREAGKSVQEAMLDAAQVTVNFQAGGKLTKFLNRNGCTFLNASVQGALQHVRNIQEGKQNAWKGVSALIAKGMVAGLGSELVKQINHLLWDDDDEYENLPDYIKQDYYLFGKFGDGTWLRLPKGRTNATIEEAIRQVALSSTGDDEADWDAFWKLFIENMAPNNPITNNLLAPILEVKSNTTWYGEDLVPRRLQDEDAVDQYDEKTDAFSVWLGEQLDYSPKKINYLLNSYTGVIGDTLLPMMTPKAESPDDSLLGQLVAPLRDKFTTDAVLNHRATEDFYEALEEAEAKAESKDATLEDKLESGMLIGYNVELSDLYAKQREIQMDKSLKNSEKYEQTREIKQKINDLQEEALKALEGYDIDGIYAEAGDKRYNFDEENDTWWEVKPKTADGDDNWYYQQEQLYHDYLGVDYADYWNGRLNPKDYKVKSLYAEENGKRYNFDMEENAWYEIKPKNKDGSDNYYYQQEQRITKDLGISPERYWNNRQMFDDFYYVAGGYEKDSPEDDTIETARAVFGYEEFAKYASELKNIKADRDKNGEIIKNSKYPKVQAYINSLDIPDIEKKILYTMQYPNYKKYKGEIVKYLDQNDDISYYSFYKILDELKYKVDSNGRVTWY